MPQNIPVNSVKLSLQYIISVSNFEMIYFLLILLISKVLNAKLCCLFSIISIRHFSDYVLAKLNPKFA